MNPLIFLSLLCAVAADYFDTYTGQKIPRRRYEELRNMSLVPWCAIEVAACDPWAPRRMDLSCNSLKYPPRGAQATPYSRMLPPDFNNGKARTASSGRPLPPPRALRVDLMSDGRVPSTRFTHMVVNYAVFVTGDITSVHDTVNYVAVVTDCCQPGRENDPRCAPLAVAGDDLHLRRSAVRCLNLTTPITYQDLGCVGGDVPPERINTVAPMLELSGVYGNEGGNAAKGRLWERGELRAETIRGKDWPPSGSPICINNEPPNETRCHDSPAGSSNSLLGINLMFIWWFRQHNYLARRLQALNTCWDDDQLFYTAREINIAYSNQLFYYEYLPVIMGRDFLLKNKIIFETSGHVDDYDPDMEPRLSIEYVTGTRWFHTLQEGRLKLYDQKGVLYDEKSIVDFTFRTGALTLNNTVEGLTQGAFRQPGGADDAVVDPDIGERILGRLQFASDVIAADIMKGRLLGLPSYNSYRRACRLPVAKTFKDLRRWMGQDQVDAISRHYESPEDIDIMAGMVAERGEGVLIPPTLACVMADQLRRWRRADRFWYEHSTHPQAFSREQLIEIRKMTTAALICQHGDSVIEIQRNVYLLPRFGSDIIPCSDIVKPDLNVFKDPKCPSEPQKEKTRQSTTASTRDIDIPPKLQKTPKEKTRETTTSQSDIDISRKRQQKRKEKRRETTTTQPKQNEITEKNPFTKFLWAFSEQLKS